MLVVPVDPIPQVEVAKAENIQAVVDDGIGLLDQPIFPPIDFMLAETAGLVPKVPAEDVHGCDRLTRPDTYNAVQRLWARP